MLLIALFVSLFFLFDADDDEAPRSKLRIGVSDRNGSARVRTPKSRNGHNAKALAKCGLELLLRASESLDVDDKELDDAPMWQPYSSPTVAPPGGVIHLGPHSAHAPVPMLPPYAYMMNPPPPSFAGVGNKARYLSSQAATTTAGAADAFFQSHKAHVLNAAVMAVADTSAKPAASAAMAWLNSLAFDVKGRLAALRKSQKRIQRVQSLFREKKKRKEAEATDASQPREQDTQMTQEPLVREDGNSGGASDSAAAIASDRQSDEEEMLKKRRAKMMEKRKLMRAKLGLPAHIYESPVAASLFLDMELALLSESRKLEAKAKKIEEMKALCVVEHDPRPGCTDVVVDAKAEHRSSASDEATTTEETMAMDIDGNAHTERPGSAKSNAAVPLSQTETMDVSEKNAGSKMQSSVMLMNQKTTAAAVISTAARVFSMPSQSYLL